MKPFEYVKDEAVRIFFEVYWGLFHGQMTSGQEGIVITKIKIYTVNLQKLSELETMFCPFSSVLQSSGHETSLIIPQKNSDSFIFHILKGFHDQSILAKDKGGKTIGTNRESPCSIYQTQSMCKSDIYTYFHIVS